MERLFDILLWAAAGACGLAIPGALFGGLVRIVALRTGQAHERSLSEAIGQGLCSGGVFLGATGFLVGAVVGFLEVEAKAGFMLLGQVVGSVVLLMLLASLAGGLSLFLFWLGAKATGLLLAIVVVLGFGGVVAWKKGVELAIVLVTQAVLGLASVVALVVSRWLAPIEETLVEADGDLGTG